jgi:Neuraminidase (sialidase)
MPAISVGPDGIVDASWYDRRDDPANHLLGVYYSYSADGGATWAKNLRVSDVSFDEKYSHHQNGMVFLGDYREGASARGRTSFVWVDTRDQKADVRLATVLRGAATPTGAAATNATA